MADSHPTDSFPDFQEGRHAFIQTDVLENALDHIRTALGILGYAHEEAGIRRRNWLTRQYKEARTVPGTLPPLSEVERTDLRDILLSSRKPLPPVGVVQSPDGTTRYVLPDGKPLYLSSIWLYLEPHGTLENCWILATAPPIEGQTVAVCAQKNA